MGEVLRPREGERPSSEARTAHRSPAITPERQPLVAPDAHHAQPCWTGSAVRRRPPCPRADSIVSGSTRWGPRRLRRPDRLSGYGIGPSVADRGAFSPPAQGASLLGSNGRITEQRPAGIGRRRWVSSWARTNQLTPGRNPTDQRPRLTPSNSGRDYQDLVKRGRSDTPSANLSLRQHRSRGLPTGQNRPRTPLRTAPAPAPAGPPSPWGHRPRQPRTTQAAAAVRHPGRHPPCAARCRSAG